MDRMCDSNRNIGGETVCKRFYESEPELDQILAGLKTVACPHCHRVSHLNRHGFLFGFNEKHQRDRTVRARRIFCSNRNQSAGCGRTFTIWAANKIKRLKLTADELWGFLKQAADSPSLAQTFREFYSEMARSAAYRIWNRFTNAQSTIRTTLGSPPDVSSDRPQGLTLAHLQAAFGDHASPIAAFQAKLQRFFM